MTNRKVTNNSKAPTQKTVHERRREHFSSFASAGRAVWPSDSQVKSALGGRSFSGGGYGTMSNRERLAEKIRNAKSAEDLREISIEAKIDQGYSDVINYYKTMYHYRYVVLPVRKLNTTNRDNQVSILEKSEEMLRIVDTLNFEAVIPNILEIGLFEGRVALYVEKRKDGAVTHILPNDYTRSLLKSNYGTDTVLFDLKYFDELLSDLLGNDSASVLNSKSKNKEEEKEKERERAELTIAILSFFPKELSNAYLEYANLDKSGMKLPREKQRKMPNLISLSDTNAAIIPFSNNSAPPKIDVAAAEQSYKEIKEVQNAKQKASLDKIFTHEIPLDEDGIPILTVDEMMGVQRSMETAFGENANVKVVSTLGKSDLLDVQKAKADKDTSVSDAYNSKFEAASINPQLFRADTDYALGVSLKRDAAFIWDILIKIMNFYNNAVNELFNFGDYSCLIKLLPITTYNEEDKVNEYRRGAEYGIGKLEAVIATGQSQLSLIDKLQLEKEMNLDELLTPLQSSHTRSAKDQIEKTSQKQDDVEEKEEEEVEEISEKKEKAEEVNNE